jgi:putative aldouronate transport system substrate-binding protein
MNKKRFILAFFCAILVFASLAACSNKDNSTAVSDNSSKAPETPAATDAVTAQPAGEKLAPVTLNWYVNLSFWKYNGDWGNDKFSQYIRDTFGVNLNFITPATDDGQKLSAMLASNDIPDLVTVEGWKNDQRKLIDPGYVWAMNDLIEKYDPSFNDIIFKDIFNWSKQADGKTYGFPNYAYSAQELNGQKLEPNTGFTLRKDIYDQLGRPDISTPDKFIDVLKRVKNEIKTYDGKPLIPLQLYDGIGASINWLQQYYAVPFEDKDGNWIDNRFNEKYYQAIKFLNTAYNAGLIRKENFSETRDQINEKVASGRVFSMFTASQDFDAQLRTLYKADSKAQFEAFVTQNYDGDKPQLGDSRGFGWLYTMVSNKTKYPDRIIKMLHFLYSQEGQNMVQFGWEGETYNKTADGKFQYTDEYYKLNTSGEAPKKWGLGFNLMADYLAVKNLIPEQTEPIEAYMQNIKKPLTDYTYDPNPNQNRVEPGDPRWNDMNALKSRLDDYWNKQVVKMILAKNDTALKAAYDEAKAQMEKIGLKQWYDFQNEGFHKTKEVLGVKFGWPGNQ